MIDDATELRIAIARVLERWQFELADLDSESSEQRRELAAMLATHIDDLKRVVTPPERSALAAEAERAARIAIMPRADRIGATLKWIETQTQRESPPP